jgi:hypothetical protein
MAASDDNYSTSRVLLAVLLRSATLVRGWAVPFLIIRTKT